MAAPGSMGGPVSSNTTRNNGSPPLSPSGSTRRLTICVRSSTPPRCAGAPPAAACPPLAQPGAYRAASPCGSSPPIAGSARQRRLEVFSGPRRIVEDVAFPVDQDMGRREIPQHRGFNRAPQIGRRGARPARNGRADPRKAGDRDTADGGVAAMVRRWKMRCFLSTEANRLAWWLTFSEGPGTECRQAQREMKDRDHLGLERRAEIDQQVAAGNQIELRERRIAQRVAREYACRGFPC